MNNIYNTFNFIYPKYHNKAALVDKLLSFLTDKPEINDQLDSYLYGYLTTDSSIAPIAIIQLIGLVHQRIKEELIIAKTNERKHFGIYYTHYEIAKLITNETIQLIPDNKDIRTLKFLEPCSGIGIFVFTYIDHVLARLKDYNKKDIQAIIDNIYCADIDPEAIRILKKILPLYINIKYHMSIKVNNNNFFEGDILFSDNNGQIEHNDPRILFNVPDGFDIVLTNPPYKLLKANSDKYSDNGKNKHSGNLGKLIAFIKNHDHFKYNEGTLNYYKLFVEEILEFHTHNDSKVGLLIPITLLNDHQSKKLRKRIVNKYLLSKLYIMREKNDFFPDISQAFCFFSLDKRLKGTDIEMITDIVTEADLSKKGIKINIEALNAISEATPIIIEKETGWNILNKINAHQKVAAFPNICNLRGELDLTLDKVFITDKKTHYPLLRGNNLEGFSFTYGGFFVNNSFITKLNGKRAHVGAERLACQQISNIHGNHRLKFSHIPPGIILGNSCNYICLSDVLFGDKNISLKYLMGLLNSLLLDWRFKITNSNNHISNYEISELPIAITENGQKAQIEDLIDKITSNNSIKDVALLNICVFNLYKLNRNEMLYVLSSFKQDQLISTIKQELNNVS
ncbi:MAG: TaqI-like C-terminal specificity domain-containing protein [Candidatus Margulisiibacteriota bacterium]